MTTTTNTTLTTPIMISSTPLSPNQRKEVDLDAILDEAFSEFDLNATASTANTAGTAPTGDIGKAAESLSDLSLDAGESSQFCAEDPEQIFMQILQTLGLNLDAITTNASPATTADGIPLPDNSHLNLQQENGQILLNLLQQMMRNPLKQIVEEMVQLIQRFKQNPTQVRELLSQTFQMKRSLITNNSSGQRTLIFNLPSLEGQEHKEVILFIDKMEEAEQVAILMEEMRIRELLISQQRVMPSSSSSSQNEEQPIKSFNEKIEGLVSQGKAKYISLEEKESARTTYVLNTKTTLTLLGIPEANQAAMMQHQKFDVEMTIAIIDALSKDDGLLESFKKGALAEGTRQDLTLEELESLFTDFAKMSRFFNEEEALRFKQSIKDYLVKHLQ